MTDKKTVGIYVMVVSYILCVVVRFFEYFVLRTDQSLLAENVYHKLFGIFVIAIILFYEKWKPHDIGFTFRDIWKVLIGFLLGGIVYAFSYGLEYVMAMLQGEEPTFKVFVEAFSMTGVTIPTAEVEFILLCLLMNVINVVMEEGLFRGVYDKILSYQYSFVKRTLLIAALFGFWHITMSIRSLVDGKMTIVQMLFMNIGYVMLAGMMSFKWAMLKEMTGSIWAGMGDHFFSNTIINLVHIEIIGGMDPLQIVRVMLANIVSFIVVCVLYYKYRNT